MHNPAGIGFIVRIDWSQTDKTRIFVKGSVTKEEAIAAVRKNYDCPRIYVDGHIDTMMEIP